MKAVRAISGSLLLVAALHAQEPSGEDAYTAWQNGMVALRDGNLGLAVTRLEAAAAALPKTPNLLFALARAEALAGKPDEALDALERAAALGFGTGAVTEPAFEALRGLPRFRALLPRIAANAKRVSRSRTAWTIPEPDLIPEGAAWDPKTRTLYVGSLHKHKIVAIGRGGRIRDFIRSGQDGIWQVLGMKVDPDRGALWVCSAEGDAPGGNPSRRSALFRFDLGTGRLTRKYPSPEGGKHLFNDLAVTRGGEVYLTDSEAGSVLRLRPGGESLEALAPLRRLDYPNGIALSDRERLLYVAHASGVAVWNLGKGETFDLASPDDVTLGGIDGLYVRRGELIAVQNGVEPNRIAAFPLSPAGDRVLGCRVLERGNPLFQIPTTGAVAGDTFYYMANTQLDALAPGNVVKDPEKRKPVVILVTSLLARRAAARSLRAPASRTSSLLRRETIRDANYRDCASRER